MDGLALSRINFIQNVTGTINMGIGTEFKPSYNSLIMGDVEIQVYHSGGSFLTPMFWDSWEVLKQMPIVQVVNSDKLTQKQLDGLVQYFGVKGIKLELA